MSDLNIGLRSDGSPVLLPLEMLTTMTAIIGRRGSGKTTTGMVLAEEFIEAGLPVVMLDPLGVHYGLRSSADGKHAGLPVTILGGQHGDVPLEQTAGRLIADLVVEQPGAYIIDFSAFESRAAEKRFAADFADRLYRLKVFDSSALGFIVDEADTFAPQQSQGDDKRMLGAFEAIARRGRVRGLGMVAITQRPAVLNKNVLSQCEVMIAHQVTAPQDREALRAWAQGNATPEQVVTFLDSLASLQVGQAWLWSPAWLGVFERVDVRRRRTFDSSATPKVGQVKVQPRVLAAVDVSMLRERMAETIERAEAEDPKKLRGQLQVARENINLLRGQKERLEGELTSARQQVSQPAEAPVCDHWPELAGLRQAVAELDAELTFTKENYQRCADRAEAAEAEEARLRGEALLLRGAVAYIRTQADLALEETSPIQEVKDGPGNGGIGSVEGAAAPGAEAGRAAGGAGGRGAATRPSDREHRNVRGRLGGVPGASRPGGVGAGEGRAAAPRGGGKDTQDMTDDEVRQLVEMQVAEQVGVYIEAKVRAAVASLPGAKLYVPPAEVIRLDYQIQAVARLMVKLEVMDGRAREVMRFMLSREGKWTTSKLIQEGLYGYSGGDAAVHVGRSLKVMSDLGLVQKGGDRGSENKPCLRERVAEELSPHRPSEDEIEEVYQAVLGRVAGEGVVG